MKSKHPNGYMYFYEDFHKKIAIIYNTKVFFKHICKTRCIRRFVEERFLNSVTFGTLKKTIQKDIFGLNIFLAFMKL